MGKLLDAFVAVGDAAVKATVAPLIAVEEIIRDDTVSDDTVKSIVGGEISDAATEAAEELLSDSKK